MTKAKSENRAVEQVTKHRKCDRKNPLSGYKARKHQTPVQFPLPNYSTDLEYTLPSFPLPREEPPRSINQPTGKTSISQCPR